MSEIFANQTRNFWHFKGIYFCKWVYKMEIFHEFEAHSRNLRKFIPVKISYIKEIQFRQKTDSD